MIRRPKNKFEPTPAEIKRHCNKIRESWSEDELKKRARHLVDDHPVEIKLASDWSNFVMDQLLLT